MTWAEILIHAVVICVGIPAAARNFTALALVASWALGQGTWMLTGNNLPLKVYFLADLTVIAMIYGKTIVRAGPKVYHDMRAQVKAMAADLTAQDRLIVALFVAGCWPIYVLRLDDWTRWHLLWGITIAQFLLAGWEALQSRRGAKRAIHRKERPSGGLQRMAGIGGMVDVTAIRQLLSVEGAAWATFVVVALLTLRMWNGAPAMFGKWIEWRIAKAAERAADWTRLRDEIIRLSETLQRERDEAAAFRTAQLAENQQCRDSLAAAERRIAVLEGYQQGQGEARQEVAVLKSAERIVEKKGKP